MPAADLQQQRATDERRPRPGRKECPHVE